MGLAKLREWVGTVTGKGDRWGRDKLGRSEPAFLSASTPALPPPTCTARGQRHQRLFFCCKAGHLWAVCFEACAGRRVRRLCPPAVALFCGLCACLSLPAMPTARSSSCPVQSFCFALPRSCPCAPGSSVCQQNQHVCKLRDCPVGSNNAGLQWRPAHRVGFNTPLPVLQDCL